MRREWGLLVKSARQAIISVLPMMDILIVAKIPSHLVRKPRDLEYLIY